MGASTLEVIQCGYKADFTYMLDFLPLHLGLQVYESQLQAS
jgi:hypothetical protein